MLIETIKRYFSHRARAKRAEPVVLSQRPRTKASKPKVLWSRDNARPGDLGTLGQELGRD